MNPRLILFVTTLLVALTWQVALAESFYIKGKKARFRSGPGTNYEILWEAPKYYPLEYLATYKEWYVIRDRQGDVGWVHSQVVGKGSAAIVIKKKANIRQRADDKSPIKFSVQEGYLFLVEKSKGNWLMVVDVEGDKGWIYKNLVWTSR